MSPLWLDPCHLPGWARRIHPSVLFGPCCLWGLDPFDPSGLFGLFGPFCLCLQYQRRRDPSLCLSLIQCLCLYRPEEEHVDRGGPLLVCVRGHIVRWLRAQAPRLAQRDEGDKSAIPLGLYAFFCGNISLPQVVELIKARHSHDEKSVQLMRNQFRNNKVELRIPRLPHPLHAVRTQQALASGVQPPPTPAAPHIAPLPEGFELDPPVTSQLHQPASARGQAPKRPAPETPASTVSEGLPSGPLSPAPPSQFSTHSSDPQ